MRDGDDEPDYYPGFLPPNGWFRGPIMVQKCRMARVILMAMINYTGGPGECHFERSNEGCCRRIAKMVDF